jgi:hypothetical protein
MVPAGRAATKAVDRVVDKEEARADKVGKADKGRGSGAGQNCS